MSEVRKSVPWGSASPDVIRKLFFSVGLGLSALAALAFLLLQIRLVISPMRTPATAVVTAWFLCHVPLYILARRPESKWACICWLVGGTLVLHFVFFVLDVPYESLVGA